MKTIFTLCFLIIFVRIHSQAVTVYEDNFGTGCTGTTQGTTCANGVASNNTKWNYQEFDNGSDIGYTFTSNYARIENYFGAAQDSKGIVFLNKRLAGSTSLGTDGVYGTYSTSNSNYIDDAFTDNTTTLEWSFLFYITHTTDIGFSNGYTYYGGAFVIGSEWNSLSLCNTTTRNTGYAVVFGSSSTDLTIQLVKFQSGTSSTTCATNTYDRYFMNNTYGTNTNACVVTDNSANLVANRWYAVKVQYNPSNDEWRLFTRHNVLSTFDPTTLSSTDGRGSKIDATYTSNWLSYMGLYASMPPSDQVGSNLTAYGDREIRLKSLKIKKNVSLIGTSAGGCGSISALPIELTLFDLETEPNKTIRLFWNTASELRNEKFIVERSENGADFYSIGEVKGHGTTQEKQDYEFIDANPRPGILYYRLRQVDYSGQSEIHKTISAEISLDDFIVFPNPAREYISLSFKNTELIPEKIEIMNYTGKLIQTDMVKENGIYSFDIKHLPKGIYFIKVVYNQNIQVKSFVIGQ